MSGGNRWCKVIRTAMAIMASVLGQATAQAESDSTVPTEPRLRLDTKMHTAPIVAVDTDRSGERVVTASSDKTARLWRASDGELLRIFRPPVGARWEGQLTSVALSPDGETLATAGRTKWAWENKAYVYLFDTATGRLERRVGGLSQVVDKLAFSADGERLAAGLNNGGGVRVWRLRDGSRVLTDTDYGKRVTGVAFGPKGRLAVASLDSDIRVYGADGQLQARRAAPDGDMPWGIAFHPDGDRLAVGYNKYTEVSVLDAATLDSAYPVRTLALDIGFLTEVAWSADGSALYAGGRWGGYDDEHHIVRWADGGRGPPSARAGPDAEVWSMVSLPGGGVVYSTSRPGVGRVGPDGETVWRHEAPTADMRGKLGDDFRVSADGGEVAFGMGSDANEPVVIDIADRTVRPVDEIPGDLASADTEDLPVTDWHDTRSPKLDGAVLELDDLEQSYSLAVAPDTERFLLGTTWYLRLFDDAGNQLWNKKVPWTASGVNIPEDGELAVAALGDGTIRWYRLKDGRLLLSLFVHRQTQPGVGRLDPFGLLRRLGGRRAIHRMARQSRQG